MNWQQILGKHWSQAQWAWAQFAGPMGRAQWAGIHGPGQMAWAQWAGSTWTGPNGPDPMGDSNGPGPMGLAVWAAWGPWAGSMGRAWNPGFWWPWAVAFFTDMLLKLIDYTFWGR
jgi:hypothetical protein